MPATKYDIVSRLEVIRWCRYWSMMSGMGIMLLACAWGVLADSPVFNKSRKAFLGAHHQWIHAGEMFVAAAFCFPYMKFEKDSTYTVVYWAMFLAMFTNGLAYAVASMSGSAWLGGEPDLEFTIWSYLSFFLVPVVCGPACFIAFIMFLVGLWNGQGLSIETETSKSK